MANKALKQEQLIDAIAAHLLSVGLDDCGLRRLAQVAGTSDRMLLYYFENKEALLAAVLSRISSGLAESLAQAFGTQQRPPARALETLWATLKSEAMAPQLRLWLDLSSRASRGDPLYVSVVAQISAEWIAWMSSIIDVDESEKAATATLMMSAMDGQSMIFPDDLQRGDQAIALLAKLLEQA